MSNPTVSGVVHVIEETKTYGQKGFRKRLVVLEQEKQRFSNYIPVEFVQDACDSADELNVGDNVEITYRLSGRKWQRDAQSEVKYFLSAEATGFRVIEKDGEGASAGETRDVSSYSEDETSFDDDDIPF